MTPTIPFAETGCTINHAGRSFTASGSWLSETGGAVYIIPRKDGKGLTAQTWNGAILAEWVDVVSEWTRHGRGGMPYRMRAVRFVVAGQRFHGSYGSDWAELCRVRAVRS